MKRLLGTILAAMMLLSLSTTAFAAVEDTGFSDVDAGVWYADAVSYVSDNHIMYGTSDTTFAPLNTMTRAMLAAVLYRVEGQPAVTGSDNFTDTMDGTWYTDAVLWAAQQGIISGYGNGLFGTNDPVTREQIATLLWRYAGQPAAENATSFADESSISAYARNAVYWARANGIVSGRSGNQFDPAASATRAEVATILRNYLASGTDNPETPTEDTRILVAYFSRTGENYGVGTITEGNTQIVAEMIAVETGGDLFHIRTVNPYPDNYEECTQVAQEEQRTNARPVLDASVTDFEEYDTVFLGYPIWWSDMPMAVYTFLESYDFLGKTVIPFSTNAGSGIAGTVQTIKDKLPATVVENGFAIAGTTAQNDRETTHTQVQQWLNGLSLPGESNNSAPATITAITMTVGNTVITAELNDSQTTRDFIALLPQTVSLSRYGDREYYGNPGGALSTSGESISDFENGDVTFYPPSGNLAIFFGNEDSSDQSGLIRMGTITSDLSVFDGFDDSITMQIAIKS